MNTLVLVSPQNFPNIINLVMPRIENATAYSVGKYKGADIVRLIASGAMQLWLAYDDENEKLEGLAITEIAQYPQRKICRFICATGENYERWFHHMEEMEKWGISMGCDGFQAECRAGWQRPLKDQGYRLSHIIMNKELGACH